MRRAKPRAKRGIFMAIGKRIENWRTEDRAAAYVAISETTHQNAIVCGAVKSALPFDESMDIQRVRGFLRKEQQ